MQRYLVTIFATDGNKRHYIGTAVFEAATPEVAAQFAMAQMWNEWLNEGYNPDIHVEEV